MHAKGLRRLAIMAVSLVILVLAFAPAAFAGGCDSDEEDCGGGDGGGAAGGVSTGFGGMATDDGGLLTFALASGGIVLITAGGYALRRQNR